MTMREFRTILQWDPDDHVWITSVPALNFLSTHGETREQALPDTREAILGYLEAAAKEGIPASESDTEPF